MVKTGAFVDAEKYAKYRAGYGDFGRALIEILSKSWSPSNPCPESAPSCYLCAPRCPYCHCGIDESHEGDCVWPVAARALGVA